MAKEKDADELAKKIRAQKLKQQEEEEEKRHKEEEEKRHKEEEEFADEDDYSDDDDEKRKDGEEDEDEEDEEDEDEEDNEEDNDEADDDSEKENEESKDNNSNDNKKDEGEDDRGKRQDEEDDRGKRQDEEDGKEGKDSKENKDGEEGKSEGNESSNKDKNDLKNEGTEGKKDPNSPKGKENPTQNNSFQNNGGANTPKPQPTSPNAPTPGPNAAPATTGATTTGATTTGATTGGAAAGSTGAGAGAGAAGGIGAVLFWVIIIIVIIIVVIGIISFFVTMPGMVVGKIGDAIHGVRAGIVDFFSGDNAAANAVGKEEVKDAAEYLVQMGYDLEGFGFLSSNTIDEVSSESKDKVSAKLDNGWMASLANWWGQDNEHDPSSLPIKSFSSDKTAEERAKEDSGGEYVTVYLSEKFDKDASESTTKKNILMVEATDGSLVYVKSKSLAMYLTADNAVWLIRNAHTSIGNKIASLIDAEDSDVGSGLTNFAEADEWKIGEYIEGLPLVGVSEGEPSGFFSGDKMSIDRATRQLKIKNSNDGWFKETWYDYNMDGWISDYGIPLQLSLALHLSSLAPDFAYKVANIGATETKVEIGLVKTTGNTIRMQLDLDLDDDGKTERYTLESKDAAHIHKYVDSGKEETYDDPSIAYKFSDAVEGLTLEEAKDKMKKNVDVDTAISNLETKLKARTEKVDLGYFAYGTITNSSAVNLGNYAFKDKASERWKIADNYIFEMKTTEELQELAGILISYGLAEIQEDDEALGTSPIKIKDNLTAEDNARVERIKKLFLDYFKLSFVSDKGSEVPTQMGYNWNNYETALKNATKIDTSKEFYSAISKKHDGPSAYKDNVYGGTYIYKNNKTDDDENEGKFYYVDNEFLYVDCDQKGTAVFWQGSTQNIWDWYFGGEAITGRKLSALEKFINNFTDYIPWRRYYRLVDENGNPVQFAKDNPEENIVLLNGAESYWDGEADKGWFWKKAIPKKLADAMIEQLDTENYNVLEDIFDKGGDVQTENYDRYFPIILSVTNHWYRDLSYKGAYIWDTSESSRINKYKYIAKEDDSDIVKNASKVGMIYMEELSEGSVEPKGAPKIVGTEGSTIKDLIDNYEYYKFDGVQKSDKPEKINFKDSAVDAIAMLEQIEGEGAQTIIRMFKELMLDYGIVFEEAEGTAEKKKLFSKIIEGYGGELLTDGEDCVYKASIPPAQEGFEEGLTVQSPCQGKITYRSDDAVCIEIDEPNENYNKYTILISGFKVEAKMGQEVKDGTKLGVTETKDLKLVLRDENGAIVKNKYVISTFDDEGNLSTIDSQTAKIYNMTAEQLDILYACVRQEAGNSYESAVAVMTCIMNRVENSRFTGDTPYEVVTQPNQFCYSIDNYWKRYLNGNVEEVVKKAVKDVLKGTRSHNYYYFRTDLAEYRAAYPNGESIGGNWYFDY